MKKRGVELSMNVIIIAAIALIVLVVLILLVTRAVRNVQSGTNCASHNNGVCVELQEGESCRDYYGDENYVSIGADCGEGATCCYKPFGGDE